MPTESRPESLEELLAELPEDLRRQAFTHSSWVEHRAEAYERLAFLGDVVLSLAVSDHLYPRFERYGAGRLTKVRAQAVSGPSCARVARALRRAGRAAQGGARGHRPHRRHAGRLGARARLGVRGDHRRGVPELRPGAHGAGGGRVVPRRDRAGAREPGGLQVGAPGAARPARRGGGLPDRVRGGPGARPQLHRAWPRWPGRSWAAGRERRRRPPSRRRPCTPSTRLDEVAAS